LWLDAAGITDIDYSAGRPLRSLCNAAARAPEYAATKQALIDRLIAEGDFEAFPDAVRLAVAVQAAGLKLGFDYGCWPLPVQRYKEAVRSFERVAAQ